MTTASIAEVKAKLSEFGERAAKGEEITVTRYGKPAFRLVPVKQERYDYMNSGHVGGDPDLWTAPPFTDEELGSFGVA